jgi:hypothetical protein
VVHRRIDYPDTKHLTERQNGGGDSTREPTRARTGASGTVPRGEDVGRDQTDDSTSTTPERDATTSGSTAAGQDAAGAKGSTGVPGRGRPARHDDA